MTDQEYTIVTMKRNGRFEAHYIPNTESDIREIRRMLSEERSIVYEGETTTSDRPKTDRAVSEAQRSKKFILQ